MVFWGVHSFFGGGGHVWFFRGGGMRGFFDEIVNEQAVHILLECILVLFIFSHKKFPRIIL